MWPSVQFKLLFCKERQRNQEITTRHVFAATVHVEVSNERQNNEQSNEDKTNESLAEQKDGPEYRKRLRYETSFNIKAHKMTTHHISRHFFSGSYALIN